MTSVSSDGRLQLNMANGKYLIVAAIVTVVFVFNLFFPSVSPLSLGHSSASPSVTHIVLFQYKQDAKPEDIAETNRQMLALKENCIHPDKGHPYIKSLTGGRDNSIESLQNGVTHAFVVEFETEAERTFYVNTDEAHQAFKKLAGGVVEKAIVVDYSPGRF